MNAAALAAWLETDPVQKCVAVAELRCADEPQSPLLTMADLSPGRPAKPQLVHPREVPRRGLGTAERRAALVHAVAHIEFNAINLALDATLRYAQMPARFYADWLSVAQDEARHFELLRQRLAELGHTYGDFPAHNGLWEAAEKTAGDLLARMALVPRVLEARGLDVTPGLIHRVTEAGDLRTAEILGIILEEEVRHVALGTHWYRWICAQRNLAAESTFKHLLDAHNMRIRPPLNRAARIQAGFDESELTALLDSEPLQP